MTQPGQPGTGALPAAVRADVENLLTPVDEHLAAAYPGPRPVRQPVHTVYVPADRYRAGLALDWGRQALAQLDDGGGMEALLEAAGVRAELRPAVGEKVRAKLATEPIEDLRIDFEDGYGDH